MQDEGAPSRPGAFAKEVRLTPSVGFDRDREGGTSDNEAR
jgi:hypothetical protein